MNWLESSRSACTRLVVDVEFLFPCSIWYLTRLLHSLVRVSSKWTPWREIQPTCMYYSPSIMIIVIIILMWQGFYNQEFWNDDLMLLTFFIWTVGHTKVSRWGTRAPSYWRRAWCWKGRLVAFLMSKIICSWLLRKVHKAKRLSCVSKCRTSYFAQQEQQTPSSLGIMTIAV